MVGSSRRFYQCVLLALLAFAAVFYVGVLPAKSDPGTAAFASTWSTQGAGAAKMRLIAAGPSHGVYPTAVEIKLAPSAHTYWRQPGEAGVPPVFSFAGSANVASAEVLYPAPQRLDEAGFAIFGYRGGVTFPIRVTPKDPAKSVRLKVTIAYAVCDRICVPAKGAVELTLPQSGAGPDAPLIAAAEARVPIAVAPQDVAKLAVIRSEPADKTKPRWSLQWKGREPASDVFVEGPEGWAFETHMVAKNIFSLAAVEVPATYNAANVAVRLTITGPAKSYQFSVPLGLPASHH
jgi:DsbC/DsbD-like thiol-disulfide interchange protein